MTTRERLRESALRLFSEKGFRGTTIAQLETGAGLAPRAGSFYRHFESKEALLSDCVETFAEMVFAELSATDFPALGNTKAELLVIGRTLLDVAERHRDIRVLLRTEARRDPALLNRLGEINDRFGTETLLPWLRRTVGDDGVSNRGAGILCAMVFGPILYYMLQQDIGQRAFGLAQEALLEGWADHWARELDRMAENVRTVAKLRGSEVER